MTGEITETHSHLDDGYYHGDAPKGSTEAAAAITAAQKPPEKPKAQSKKK